MFPRRPNGIRRSGPVDQRYRIAGVADVVGQLAGFADRPAHQQLMLVRAGIQQQPVIQAMAFAAQSGGQALPAFAGCAAGQLIRPQRSCGGGEPLVAGHGHDIVEVVIFQPCPQSGVVAVGLVRGEPAHLDTGLQHTVEHPLGQYGFGRELDLGADSGLLAAFPVLDPGRRQVKLAVDQRPASGRDVGQEHAELTVLDPPGGAGVLSLHSGGCGAL